MPDAGLDADVVLDIRQALAQVGRLEDALGRTSEVRLTADARAVTAAIDAAVQNADLAVQVVGEAADVTGSIDAAVEAADTNVVVTGDAADVTGAIDAAVQNSDTSVSVEGQIAPGLSSGVEALGDSLDAAATSGVSLQTLLAGLSVGAAVAGLRELADAASDLEESTSKATVVFGQQFSGIQRFAEGAAAATGLSEQAALEATATFGNLFQALGSTREEAAAMSPDVVQLAADLASFNNIGVDEALEKIRSGLVGEIEPLRSLGVSFLAADVKAKGMALGLADANGELSEGAKVQARLALITEQTTLAQGDFSRTSEGLANQQRILQAELGNAAAAAGTLLLPAFQALVGAGRDAIPALQQLAANLLPALGSAIENLAPLLGTSLDLLLALSPALQLVLNIVGAIPAPVIQAVAVLLTLNRTMKLLQATTKGGIVTNLVGGLTGLVPPATQGVTALQRLRIGAGGVATSLKGLTTGLSGATLAAGLGFTAFSMYQDVMAGAKREGEEFGASIRASVGDLGGKSMRELTDLTETLDSEIVRMQGDVDDSFLGRNGVNRDYNASLHEGINQMRDFKEEVVAAQKEMLRLEAEADFGPLVDSLTKTGDALARLREDAPTAEAAIFSFKSKGADPTAGSLLDLALGLDGAKLSEEQMADAALALGTDVETLQGFIEASTTALETFIETAVGGLPSLSQAFVDANNSGKVSAREFINGLVDQTTEVVTFLADLKTIVAAGFSEVAGVLAEQGVEVAGTVAHQLAEAAREGNKTLLAETQFGLDARDQAIADSTLYFADVLGPDFVALTGQIAQFASQEWLSGLTIDEQTKLRADLAALRLSEKGKQVAAVAATAGESAARRYGLGLDLPQKTIDAAVKAGTALRENAPTGDAKTAGVATGEAFATGVMRGIEQNYGNVAEKAAQLVLQARAAAARAAEEGSPSKLFAELGANMALGVAQGIEEEVAAVQRAAEALVTDAARTAAAVSVPRIEVAAPPLSTAAAGDARTLVVVEAGAIRVEVTGAISPEEAVEVGEGIADGLAERLAERGLAVQGRAQ